MRSIILTRGRGMLRAETRRSPAYPTPSTLAVLCALGGVTLFVSRIPRMTEGRVRQGERQIDPRIKDRNETSMEYRTSVDAVFAAVRPPLVPEMSTSMSAEDFKKFVDSHRLSWGLSPYTAQWVISIASVIHAVDPRVIVTSWVRPYRHHRSLHQLGRAVDIQFPKGVSALATYDSLHRALSEHGLINMSYFGLTRKGNWVMHVEVHSINADGSASNKNVIRNGRVDNWLR